MKGIIKNFRGGMSTQYPDQCIIETKAIKSRSQASSLVGRKVIWESPSKKSISGKIVAVHGNNGAVRAKLVKGIPGEAIGQKIEIL